MGFTLCTKRIEPIQLKSNVFLGAPSRANRPLPFFAYPCHCIHLFGSHDGPCALYVGAEFSVVRGHGAYRQLPGRRSKMAVTENAVGVSLSGEALALTPESSTPVRGQFE